MPFAKPEAAADHRAAGPWWPGPWLRAHGLAVTGMVIVLLVFVWFVTYGTWNVFQGMFFGDVYDGQAVSLLHGRLDVPLSVIRHEAFLRKQDYGRLPTFAEEDPSLVNAPDPFKWYEEHFPGARFHMYFGIAPALLRLPLIALFPKRTGHWSQVMMTVACALNLIFAYRLLWLGRRLTGAAPRSRAGSNGKPTSLRPAASSREEKIAYAVFVLLVGLGSTNIYLASASFLYHEAITWGATFALMCYYYLLRHLVGGRTGPLAGAGVCASLSMLSRPTSGAGAEFALALFAAAALVLGGAWLARRSDRDRLRIGGGNVFGLPVVPPRVAAVLVVVVAGITTAGVYGMINYAKFGSLSGPPLSTQVFQSREVLQRTGGKLLAVENMGTAFISYFGPKRFSISGHFPWINEAQTGRILPGALIQGFQPYIGLPVSAPALLTLALVGCVAAFSPLSRLKKFRLPLIGGMAGGVLILAGPGVTERYVHDFYPFLVVAGAAGLLRFLALRRRWVRWALYPVLVGLVLVSIYVSTAEAMLFQREGGWAPPEWAEKLEDWCERIDYRLNHQHVAPTALAAGNFGGGHVTDLVAIDQAGEQVRVLPGGRGGAPVTGARFPAGATPCAVAVGDFNGDGLLDLAVVDRAGGSVRVLLGTGGGRFAEARSLPAGFPLHAVVVGDFNGDGHPDVAAAGGAGLCVWLGNGDGSFRESQNPAPGQGGLVGLAVGDFNGDGHPDLAAVGTAGGCILLGNGDGSFREPVPIPGAYSGVVVGDFNGDGHQDLVVAADSGAWILLGNGDGSFREPVSVAPPDNVRGLAAADFDGDGKLDLALVSATGIWVARGNGDGSFHDCRELAGENCRRVAEGDFRCLAVSDFNGDGHPDIAAGGRFGLRVLWGRGDGTFRTDPD